MDVLPKCMPIINSSFYRLEQKTIQNNTINRKTLASLI